MEKTTVNLKSLMLMGLSTRTNNKKELNPESSKIGALVHSYRHYQVADTIKHRAHPGITYCVYTEYENNEHGDYTYFIGEEVSSIENQDIQQFTFLIIPESRYQKFTTAAGVMPEVVIKAWQEIWQMTPSILEGNRRYKADFEIYDQRANDPDKTIVDVYIGIESQSILKNLAV